MGRPEISKRKPGRPPTEKGPRHVRLTIGFYPDEMEAIRKAADNISGNISAFIREAAVAKAKRAK